MKCFITTECISSSQTQNFIISIKFNINNCNSLKRLTAIAYTLCQAQFIMVTKINGIGNYYGSLHVKKENKKYYMKVFCEIAEKDWKEISKELYDMLVALNCA